MGLENHADVLAPPLRQNLGRHKLYKVNAPPNGAGRAHISLSRFPSA
ncbi:Uncharacterised protein [Vibrio cholerae]|nr:Uncharacterised protein [Vibrio cholerae]